MLRASAGCDAGAERKNEFVGAVVRRGFGVSSGCQQDDYAYGKGDTSNSSKNSSVEKRATGERDGELEGVKEGLVAIEVGVEVDRSW
jgi:hypothetical protein